MQFRYKKTIKHFKQVVNFTKMEEKFSQIRMIKSFNLDTQFCEAV